MMPGIDLLFAYINTKFKLSLKLRTKANDKRNHFCNLNPKKCLN